MKYGYAILATILWSLVSIGSWTAGLFIGAILVSGGLIASKAALYLDIAKNNFNGTDNIYRGLNFFSRTLGIVCRVLRVLLEFVLKLLIRLAILLFFGFIMANIIEQIEATEVSNVIAYISAAIGFAYGGLLVLYLVRYLIQVYFRFYILVDSNNELLSSKECIRISKDISKGNLLKIFMFELSFVFWRLGVLLTLGALNLYFEPYYNTSKANLYIDVRDIRQLNILTIKQ